MYIILYKLSLDIRITILIQICASKRYALIHDTHLHNSNKAHQIQFKYFSLSDN